jgi:hypothetical protein
VLSECVYGDSAGAKRNLTSDLLASPRKLTPILRASVPTSVT